MTPSQLASVRASDKREHVFKELNVRNRGSNVIDNKIANRQTKFPRQFGETVFQTGGMANEDSKTPMPFESTGKL
ncbi:hypothetical protein PHMEG_00026268 [Phytophthora megakarya]|uniref:Uncharacterized protein n=1 Tax=Phytophthora megakarya TaxID=4795 RepID=A0A225V9Z8_9STRA|nr:hypothetical protein PHMEG_00026268 [Phytophthora megakarya]